MPSQERKPRRVRAPRPRLSRSLVVAAGIEIVRGEGLRQLSMRALAERLGVTPMAVYKHVENRDELVLWVVTEIFSTLALPDERLEPLAWLRELAGRVRALGLENRGVMDFLLDEGPVVAGTLVLLDRTVRKLHDAGVPWEEAGELHNTFFSWLAGAVRRQEQWEARRSDASPLFQRFFAAAAAMSPSEYPGIAHSLPHMQAMDVEAEFETSLGFMLEGIQRRIEASRSASPRGRRTRQT
ncbi:TetR/AcrR family transcriptional regulator [Hyalangium rubrum]|uniref:TetR/AcrR family transcriptional regulator n=1 Tax=Hyalangium rubrum TaxID=3103134 RepID=A0ABU5GZQ9_9BACT|nr:TetR/AcrR family transcriptional regulator [Hyalangium sp. s54d21]MDY7226685.1 TetR/AcrR family transcriptional regulator [Hyalangium sp. s54d21]